MRSSNGEPGAEHTRGSVPERLARDLARGGALLPERQVCSGALADRRNRARVPMSAGVHWRCGGQDGQCRLLDVAPGGAALVLPLRDVFSLDAAITLNVELDPGMTWCLTDQATVVRRSPRPDRTCRVAVAFPLPGTGA